ncbi:MAG TPA: DAK2 domain-containing protein, partial [Gaiellaceae bacterium]|nr:DAK2 domain-containing protein [Gaiellaceae bacterium]
RRGRGAHRRRPAGHVTELERAKELGQAALASLEANRRRIDDLNVYPVPDGDTGTNMTLTARAIMEVLDASTASDRATLAKELTRAALMGARGNSGVIFSQILRGAAEALGEAGLLDAATIRRAFRAASDAAYRAVRRPVEGTMLTVIRELAEEAEDPRNADLEPAALLKRLIERGEDALARTPDMLDVLKEAGVVDAGGAGLLEIVRGVSAALSGEPLPDAPPEDAHEAGIEAVHQELSEFRYCTVFVVEGENLDADALEAELDRLGDSLLVVGDETALKIHVHTDEPGKALAFGTALGTIEGVEIANMHLQTAQRSERILESVPDPGLTLETGVVAVVPGAGNRRLFESYGATRVIEGGQTMNPSTADILAAIEATPATEVLVLPNNSNVILSAEQAAKLAEKPVRVIPSRSVPAGLAAIVRYLPSLDAAENEAAMLEALEQVATGEVTLASRDVKLDGVAVRKGAWLGLADGSAVASSADFEDVACAVVDRLLGDGREVLTLLTGEDEPDLDDFLRRVQESHPGVELDVQPGGQPHYPLLLSAE